MAGLDPLRYHAKSAPQWAQFTHKEFRLKEVEDKELLRVLSEAGYIRGGCHKDRAEWTISQRKDLRLDRLSLSKAQKLYAERLFLSCCGEEYVQSVILPMAGPVRSVALTGGQYDICLKAIFEYLAKQQKNPSAQPLYVLVYEPAIYLGFGIKRKVRADYLDILRQHIVPQAVYIDGQERRNLSSTEPARLVVDIYTNRKAFEKYFQAQWKEKAKKSGLLVSTGGSEALSRSIPEASHAEPALATIAQSANPADPAVAKAFAKSKTGKQGRVFLPAGVSFSKIENAAGDGKRILYRRGKFAVKKVTAWPIYNTSISEIDKSFRDVLGGSLIDKIALQASVNSVKRFYVMDWGAGDLTAAKELLRELRDRGVFNVHVIATVDIFSSSMMDVLEKEPQITLVVAPFEAMCETLSRAIPEGAQIEAAYSMSAFHFLFDKDRNKAEVVDHLTGLRGIMSPNGFFVFNIETFSRVMMFYELLSSRARKGLGDIWTHKKEKVIRYSLLSTPDKPLADSLHVVFGQEIFSSNNAIEEADTMPALEPALATIAQSANPADPAVAKALEVFNYVNAGISGIDVEIENVIDKLRKSGFTLDDTKARLVNTALREAYYVVDKIEFLPPGQLSSADGIGLVADRDGVGPSLEEMSRKENGLVYVMTRDDKVIDHDYSGDMWIHSNGGDNSALFLVDLNKKTIEPISVGKKVRIITARAAAESWVKEFKPATNPTKFLRNIVDTKELTQNMIEGILSALFSNKKLTLAFSKKLKGLESAQLRSLVRQLNEWKESTARKNKRMKALMNHFTILEYDNLKIALHEYDIDANARDGLIFAYAPKPKDVSGDMANMGSAVKPVYIIEESDGFPADYYYPLLEMVTVSLAKELLQWDESQLREALAASNITAISLGIDTDIDEKLGILIFKVLPKMRRYDNNSRIDRYTRLMQFLRSA